jgi:hypothetical protein
MEVFVLMGVLNYEGDMLLGVYVSLEEATDARYVSERNHRSCFDSYYIDRRVIGAPGEINFDYRVQV